MSVIDISRFNSPREYYAALSDQAQNSTDRAIIDHADGEAVMELEEEWWESHRAEFSLEFEETEPAKWGEVLARTRARMEGWVADRLRERVGAAA